MYIIDPNEKQTPLKICVLKIDVHNISRGASYFLNDASPVELIHMETLSIDQPLTRYLGILMLLD